MKKHTNRLVSLHRRQVRRFDRTAKAIQREFRRMPEAQEFLGMVKTLQDLADEQFVAATSVIAVAAQMPAGEGNRTQEFMEMPEQGDMDSFLTSRRKIAEQLGEIDEHNKALAAVGQVMEKAKSIENSDPRAFEAACKMTWRLSSCQNQIHSLARQVEAITSMEDAILRAFGLNFWQGRKRHLRWEGQKRWSDA